MKYEIEDTLRRAGATRVALDLHATYAGIACERVFGRDENGRNFGVWRFRSFNELLDVKLRVHDGERWTWGEAGPKDTPRRIRERRPLDAHWSRMKQSLEQLQPLIGDLEKRAPSRRRRRRFGEEGSDLSLDRLMSGQPEHWETRKRNGSQLKVVLGINIGLSCTNTESAFVTVAARTAAAAQLFERLGYAVELWGCAAVRNMPNKRDPGRDTAMMWPVKRTTDRLDAARILTLAFPGAFRAYVFSAWRAEGCTGTLGQCTRLTNTHRLAMGVDFLVGRDWTNAASGELKQTDRIEGLVLNLQKAFTK